MSPDQINNDAAAAAEPKPCANNCGFFGSAATMNLCSGCLKAAAAAKHALKTAAPDGGSQTAAFSHKLTAELQISRPAPSAVTKAANRCRSCNRKVGLTGFVCKCGSTFCGAHRYPEKHECGFDFKRAGRDAIAAANPLVKADKITRF